MTDWDARRMSFGAQAQIYDSYRPDWPAGTAAWLTGTEDGAGPLSRRAAASGGGLDVLDLGAGTGKLTRSLVQAGHRVTAMDPSEGMLAVLASSSPQVTVVLGSAEQIALPQRCVDAVTIAQAWHWMDGAVAAAQCARVLRPGGVLSIGWHRRRLSDDWTLELDRLVESQEGLYAREHSYGRPVVLPAEFGELQSAVFEYDLYLTPEALASLAASWSFVSTRPDRDELLPKIVQLGRRVLEQDGAAGSASPERAASPERRATAERSDGLIRLPHLTYCYRAFRLP